MRIARMLSDRLSKATIVAMVMVGTTAWLSLGVLAVVDDAGTRIGLLPRVWLLALTIVLAVSAAVTSRFSGRATLPLYLSLLVVLPWLPLPVPELFLIWTGPIVLLVWGGVALYVVAIVTEARSAPALGLFRDARRAPRLAAVLAFIAFVSVRLAVVGPPGGDEPHYLLITQSLLEDGDITIANNYERQDYLEYWRGPLQPHFSRPAANGDLYSGHAPGLSVLAAPAFAIGGYPGTVVWIAMLTALGSMFVWRAGYIFTRDVGAAWFGWSAVVLTAPVALHGTLMFPDPIAGVLLAGGALALVSIREWQRTSRDARGQEGSGRERWSLQRSFATGVPVALLPWLHTRLALPAALLGLALLLRLGAAIHRRAATWGDIAAFATPIVLSLGSWFAFFRIIYGSFNPSAPHWDVPLVLNYVPIGLTGLLADQEFGLVANVPVHMLWAAGLWSLFKHDRRLAAELLLVVVPYVIVVSAFPGWFGGASPPARYLVPVVFPLGFALAVLWGSQDAAGRSMSLALLALSMLVAAVLAFGGDGGLAYNQGTGRARWLEWIAPLVNLPRALPSFFRAGWDGTAPRASALAAHLLNPAIVWSLSILVGWFLFRLLVARIATTIPARAVLTSCCLLTVLAVGVNVTWSLAGGTPITSTRSQLRLLRADDPRQHSFGVRLPGIRTLPAVEARAQLALSTSRLDDPPPGALLYVTDVPAGEYQFRVTRRPSASGEVSVGIGRATTAAWRASLADGSIDGLTVHLPIAASSVVVNGDEAAKQFVEAAALVPTPRREQPSAMSDARARDAARYGDLVVFAIDDRVILDPRGFWVLAGRQPDVVVSTDKSFHALDLEIRNVAVANRVGVSAGQWSVERSLAPDEVWRVRVPVVGLGGSFRLGFNVDSGLPASKGQLGCRVEIR